jgi:hypothetical protein
LVYNLFEVAWHGHLASFRIPGGEAPSAPSWANLRWSNFVANANMLIESNLCERRGSSAVWWGKMPTFSPDEERQPMLEELVLLALCFLVAVMGLTVVALEAISGRIFSLDGLWLCLISLTLAAVFGGNVAWSFYTGEAQQMLRHSRKASTPHNTSDKKQATTA